MTQYSIQSEFEVWTTFVLDHSQDENDYKFAEKLGETVHSIKQHHQELCYERAGTTAKLRDWAKMGPFIAAMYVVTAGQVTAATAENKRLVLRGGQHVPVRTSTLNNIPFMSFPWIFARELGQIATRRSPGSSTTLPQTAKLPARPALRKKNIDLAEYELEPLQDISTVEGVVHEGDLLDVYHQSEVRPATNVPFQEAKQDSGRSTSLVTAGGSGEMIPEQELQEPRHSMVLPEMQTPQTLSKAGAVQAESSDETEITGDKDASDADDEAEEEVTLGDERGSALDSVSRLVGFQKER